jgi:hypothetical protein
VVRVLERRVVGGLAGEAFPYPRNKHIEFIGSENLQERKVSLRRQQNVQR